MARAGKGAGDGEKLRPARRGSRGNRDAGPQMRRPHRDGWTERKKKTFLDVLKATCNVQEAVRSVGMSSSGLYSLRDNDPAFRAGWKEALEQGYMELELHLLSQSLFGVKTTETIDDGKEGGAKRTKTVHSFPHLVAVRLLLAHKDTVQKYRAEQGIERPGSDAVREEIQRRIAGMRGRGDDEEGGSGSADE